MSRDPVRPYNLVPADPARQRLLELRAAGASYHQIAAATGISANVLNSVARGMRRRISAENASLIATCTPAPIPLGALVDATGTKRRLQALAREGWTVVDIAERTRCDEGQLFNIRLGHLTTIKNVTAQRIAKFYDRPGIAPDGYGRARAQRQAERNGWAPAAAWDDIDTDPEPTGIRTGHTHPGADLDEWLDLVNAGEDGERAARRLGVSISAIARSARRHGRLDIAQRADIARNQTRRAAA